MNTDQIEGRWREMKGKIREKWGELTDDELDKARGKWDQLAGIVQRKYGTTRDEVDRTLTTLRREYGDL
jgi:uncharacterized protein YjbJ (UPF0337 family)